MLHCKLLSSTFQEWQAVDKALWGICHPSAYPSVLPSLAFGETAVFKHYTVILCQRNACIIEASIVLRVLKVINFLTGFKRCIHLFNRLNNKHELWNVDYFLLFQLLSSWYIPMEKQNIYPQFLLVSHKIIYNIHNEEIIVMLHCFEQTQAVNKLQGSTVYSNEKIKFLLSEITILLLCCTT